jgi:hypothetical protein
LGGTLGFEVDRDAIEDSEEDDDILDMLEAERVEI